MKKINRKAKMIMLGSISTITLAVIPAAVVACSSDSSNSSQNNNSSSNSSTSTSSTKAPKPQTPPSTQTPQEYINTFEKSSKTITGFNSVLPTNITPTSDISFSTAFNNYFNGLITPPSGSTATFTVATDSNSDLAGTVSLVLTLTTNNTILVSTAIIVGGFLTTNQAAIDAYIASFETANITWLSYTTVPTNISPNSGIGINTIQSYFNGIPNTNFNWNENITPTYTVTTTATSDATGIVNLSVTLTTPAPYATTTTSKPITVGSWQSAITNYVNLFNQNSPNITGNSNYMPSSLPATINANLPSYNPGAELSQYFNNIPQLPNGINAIFNLTTNANSSMDGTINLSVTLSTQLNTMATPSNSIQVSGFGNQLIQYIDNIVSENIPLKALNDNISPASIPTSLDINNISKYISGVPPLPVDTTAIFTISNPSVAAGTIVLSISLNYKNIYTYNPPQGPQQGVLITGFSSQNQNYVNAFNKSNDSSNKENITIAGVSTILPASISTTLSSSNIDQYFSFGNMPSIPSGTSPVFTVSNASNTTGEVTLSVTFNSYPSLTSSNIVVKGFLTTNQNAINNYISTFETGKGISVNSDIGVINTMLPSAFIANIIQYFQVEEQINITNTNALNISEIQQYINGIITPSSGITAIYSLTTNANSSETGIVYLSVTLNADNAVTINSKPISLSGFLTANQNWMNNFKQSNQSGNISGNQNPYDNKIIYPTSVPKTLTEANINNYITSIPTIPSGSTVSFTTSKPSNSEGNIVLTITLSYANASSLGDLVKPITESFTISGFQQSYNS